MEIITTMSSVVFPAGRLPNSTSKQNARYLYQMVTQNILRTHEGR